MNSLYDSQYFYPDMEKLNYAVNVIITGLIVILLVYLIFLILMEIIYFIKCKICKERFDWKVVIRMFTDFED